MNLFIRADSGERVVVVVNLSGNFLGKYRVDFLARVKIIFLFFE